MSITSSGIDARAYLSGWLNGLQGMYSADIRAIPDDKWDATFGGCTRSACEVTADAISLLDWTTKALQGNPPADYGPGNMDAMKAQCATKDAATAKLASSIADFNAALNAASDDTLNAVVTPPWQMDAPMFMLCQIAVSHIWYHDGQLNYIQCLLGDEKVHWMGD
ncbi:MAG TPA: hypothetical protein PLX06_02735 [Fimbriimonadaceae bacterium]|nr:hypothetical protein [Fimbriimonadaceae bacterium]